MKPGQAGQIPVRAAGAGGQDGKGAGRVVLQKLFQGFLLQLIILQQVNVNAQIRPLRYHALDVDAGKALRPGLDGEGPGNVKSTGSLHLPDAPGSFAAALVPHVNAEGFQRLPVAGPQSPVQQLVVGAGLIFQHLLAQGEKVPFKRALREGKGQVQQVSDGAVGIPLHIPQGPVHRALYEKARQVPVSARKFPLLGCVLFFMIPRCVPGM